MVVYDIIYVYFGGYTVVVCTSVYVCGHMHVCVCMKDPACFPTLPAFIRVMLIIVCMCRCTQLIGTLVSTYGGLLS